MGEKEHEFVTLMALEFIVPCSWQLQFFALVTRFRKSIDFGLEQFQQHLVNALSQWKVITIISSNSGVLVGWGEGDGQWGKSLVASVTRSLFVKPLSV